MAKKINFNTQLKIKKHENQTGHLAGKIHLDMIWEVSSLPCWPNFLGFPDDNDIISSRGTFKVFCYIPPKILIHLTKTKPQLLPLPKDITKRKAAQIKATKITPFLLPTIDKLISKNYRQTNQSIILKNQQIGKNTSLGQSNFITQTVKKAHIYNFSEHQHNQ